MLITVLFLSLVKNSYENKVIASKEINNLCSCNFYHTKSMKWRKGLPKTMKSHNYYKIVLKYHNHYVCCNRNQNSVSII